MFSNKCEAQDDPEPNDPVSYHTRTFALRPFENGGRDPEGRYATLCRIFDQSPRFNPTNLEAKQAICEASFASDLPLLRALIRSGVDVNSTCSEGNWGKNTTPLHESLPLQLRSQSSTDNVSDMQVFEYLMSNGADVHHHLEGGYTILHRAMRDFDPEVFRRLVEGGASTSATTDWGENLLHWHCVNANGNLRYETGKERIERDVNCLRTLLAAGLDANAVTNNGRNALHLLVTHREEEEEAISGPALIKILIEHGADPHMEDAYGYTPLKYAYELDECKLDDLRQYGINEYSSETQLVLREYTSDWRTVVQAMEDDRGIQRNRGPSRYPCLAWRTAR